MSTLGALSLTNGFLGALWTFITLSGWVPVQVWASFVAWGCFYHAGGKTAGLKSSIVGNAYGAIVAWVVLTIWQSAGVKGQVASRFLVALLVFAGIVALIMAANWPSLSAIPANVYGFATMVGVTLATQTLTGAKLLAFDAFLRNPLIGTIVAMAMGAMLAYTSERYAGRIAKS